MNPHQKFPWLVFTSISVPLFIGLSWLAIVLMQQNSRAEAEQMFTSISERLRGEFATIIALQDGLATHVLTLNNLDKNINRDIDLYIESIHQHRNDISLYVLPKITSTKLSQYEEKKQEEGYLNFHVFGNPEADPLNSNALFFPSELVKKHTLMGLKHLGRDLYSYPYFREAIDEAAAKHKTIAAWSHFTGENNHGNMLFQPIYDTNSVDSIPESKRMNHVQAMVATELFLDELLNNIVDKLDIDEMNYDISLQTYRASHQPKVSHLSQNKEALTESWLPTIYFSQTLALLDKPITVSMQANTDLKRLSWFRGLGVLLVGILVIVLLYLFIKQRQLQQYDRQQAREALQKERDKAESTLTSLGEGVLTTDLEGRLQYLNPKARALFDSSALPERLEGQFFIDIYPAQFRKEANKVMEGLALCREGEQLVHLSNLKTTNKAGDAILLDCTLSPMRQSEGEINGVALVLEDVTHLEDMRLQIENMAKRDHLTGLFNRYEFEQQIRETIVDAHSQNAQHAFCYLDLDQFKVVNDTAGHMAGDQLLRQLSGTVFLRSLPNNAILGRLGGDEFGLLLYNTTSKQATAVCEQIIRDIQHFIFLWQDKRFRIGVSIGLVMIDQLSLSVEQILISADTACYLAKEKGRNRVESADNDNVDMRQRQEELTWAERIPRAIDENRFVLFIQYMLPLTGVIAHAEVLVRMKDEQGKLLSPNQFIPAAERYGIMTKVDRWIILRSLDNISKIVNDRLDDGIIYSINLSGQSLTDDGFLNFIHTELSTKPEIAKRICFEITETATMGNLVQALRCMKLLKDLGSTLALDDFGSGLSSFAYLRQMPVDYLKIDGAFVHNIHKDAINRAIVANMHQLAGVFGLKTVAEYAENEAIVSELRKIGVDLAQGYGVHVPEEWIV